MGEGGGKGFGFQSSQFQGQGYGHGKDQNGSALFASPVLGGWRSIDTSLSCLFFPQASTSTPAFSGEAGEGRQELTKKNETLDSLDPSPLPQADSRPLPPPPKLLPTKPAPDSPYPRPRARAGFSGGGKQQNPDRDSQGRIYAWGARSTGGPRGVARGGRKGGSPFVGTQRAREREPLFCLSGRLGGNFPSPGGTVTSSLVTSTLHLR